MQTGWSQDQGIHKWALVSVPACLPLALHFYEKILPKINFCKLVETNCSWRPLCIPGCNGLKTIS